MVYLFPFIAIYFLYLILRNKRNVLGLVTFFAIFLFGLVAEMAIYYKFTHDLFYRFHETQRNFAECNVWFWVQNSKSGYSTGNYLHALIKRLVFEGPKAIFMSCNFGNLNACAVLGLLYAVYKKEKNYYFLGLWFVSLVLMFNFMSSSAKKYEPLILFDRYLYPILFPALIIVAGFINGLVPSLTKPKVPLMQEKYFWGMFVVSSIVAFCLVGYVKDIREGKTSPFVVEHEIAMKLGPRDKIFTDFRTAWAMKFWWKYPAESNINKFEKLSVADIDSGYVILNHSLLRFENENYKYIIPEFCIKIPKSWKKLWSGNNSDLYMVMLNNS